MGIMINLFIAMMAMTFVAIDIIAFFLLVRAASELWPAKLLLAFDQTGKPLTDYYLQIAQRVWDRLTNKTITEKQKLLIGLCFLLVARLILSAFGQLVRT